VEQLGHVDLERLTTPRGQNLLSMVADPIQRRELPSRSLVGGLLPPRQLLPNQLANNVRDAPAFRPSDLRQRPVLTRLE
jgi:hypothetical protein